MPAHFLEHPKIQLSVRSPAESFAASAATLVVLSPPQISLVSPSQPRSHLTANVYKRRYSFFSTANSSLCIHAYWCGIYLCTFEL